MGSWFWEEVMGVCWSWAQGRSPVTFPGSAGPTRIMAVPFCTLKELAFYIHFVKSLRAFQGCAVLTSGRKIHVPLSPFYPSSFACTPVPCPLEQWLLRVSRVREGLGINCFVLKKCGDGQPVWRLMCTLELDPRLVDRCQLWTLSSDKAISRITSWGGGGKMKALLNWKPLWEPAGTIAEC